MGATMREIRKDGESTIAALAMRAMQPRWTAAVCGLASGVALGAVVGPAGVIAGIALGCAIGLVIGHVLAREEAKRNRRTRELDAIIGITDGSIGAGISPTV